MASWISVSLKRCPNLDLPDSGDALADADSDARAASRFKAFCRTSATPGPRLPTRKLPENYPRFPQCSCGFQRSPINYLFQSDVYTPESGT
jgi:hypothetical protein